MNQSLNTYDVGNYLLSCKSVLSIIKGYIAMKSIRFKRTLEKYDFAEIPYSYGKNPQSKCSITQWLRID